MNKYLSQANELFIYSKEELNNAKRLKNISMARDASGKAWIATTDALRGFLITQGLKQYELPKSERQRQDKLMEFGNEKMRLLYYAIRTQIHEDAYYEGIINYLRLFEVFNQIKKFIQQCENGK